MCVQMSHPWYYGIHVTKYSTVRERASWVGRITSGLHAVELHLKSNRSGKMVSLRSNGNRALVPWDKELNAPNSLPCPRNLLLYFKHFSHSWVKFDVIMTMDWCLLTIRRNLMTDSVSSVVTIVSYLTSPNWRIPSKSQYMPSLGEVFRFRMQYLCSKRLSR